VTLEDDKVRRFLLGPSKCFEAASFKEDQSVDRSLRDLYEIQAKHRIPERKCLK
jgi:hypothetical protein